MNSETDTKSASVLDFTGDWYLVRVKPQKEERMARELSALGVKCFLPREHVTKTYERANGSRQTKTYARLAWTGYLFVCGDDAVRGHVWDSLWNISINRIVDSRKLVRFLAGYETRFAEDCPAISKELRVGVGVEVIAGSLRRTKGIIDRIDGRRIWINTLILGDLRTVEIERPDYLELL